MRKDRLQGLAFAVNSDQLSWHNFVYLSVKPQVSYYDHSFSTQTSESTQMNSNKPLVVPMSLNTQARAICPTTKCKLFRSFPISTILKDLRYVPK